jgi:hypothetical protein
MSEGVWGSKLIFSKKATKIDEIFTLVVSYYILPN